MPMLIRWNLSAFEELRRSPEIEALLQEIVDDLLEKAGYGYVGGVEPGKSRSRGYVSTADYEAIVREAQTALLVRLLSEEAA